MKQILLSAAVLLSVGLQAQVGINTDTPTKTLDVNGTSRVRNIPDCSDTAPENEKCQYVLVADGDGNIKRVLLSTFTRTNSDGSSSSEGNGNSGNVADLGDVKNLTLTDVEGYVVSLTYNSTQLQGKIDNDTNKVQIQIPYTGGNGSTYSEVTAQATTTAVSSQHGTPTTATLTIPAGQFKSGAGFIPAEVSTGTNYDVKMLAPGAMQEIATFKVKVNGQEKTIVVKAIGGIPDKLFGKRTNDKLEHQFIYLPIEGPDGKIWLNNNLGADYANMNKDVFNPSKQATSRSDYHAYGSSFQYGRFDETGYELIDWTGSKSGHAVYTDKGWRSNSELNDINWNPCPEGYRLPTGHEFETLRISLGGNPNNKKLASSSLKLPAANYRISATTTYFGTAGTNGRYWSSTPLIYSDSKYLFFYENGSYVSSYDRSVGFSVRCLKD